MTPEIQSTIDQAIKDHTHDGNFSQRVNSLDVFNEQRAILYRVLGPTTVIATGTSIGGDLVVPFSGSILDVGATVDVAGITGTMQLDINVNATTILSTKITIDTAEKTSRTAAVPSFVSLTNLNKGDIITFDVDTVQTTPAQGLTFFIIFFVTTY